MARRKSNNMESAFVAFVVVVAIVAWSVSKVLDTVGPIVLILAIVLGIAAVVWFKHVQRQKRIQLLLGKYGDQEIVDRIMRGGLWQGQTAQQLVDSLGSPLNIDRKIMATRKREIWKYAQTGRGRYALRITLDNDVVIEIDQKTS